MAQSQLIKGNDVNNISVLLLKEPNMYDPRIRVPKQHHKHRSLTAAHLNEVLIYGIDFAQGGKSFSLFMEVKTFSAQRSTDQKSIHTVQMCFTNASS